MLGRASRFSTVAQVLSSVQKFGKDGSGQQQQQRKEQQATNTQFPTPSLGLTTSSSFSSLLHTETGRKRCPSFKNDPVLGFSAEENVIHGFELLDLDGWNVDKSVRARSPSPITTLCTDPRSLNWMDNYVDLSSIELDTSAYKLLQAPPCSPFCTPPRLDEIEDAEVDLSFWQNVLDGKDCSSTYKLEEPKQEPEFFSTTEEELTWNSVVHKPIELKREVKLEVDDLMSSGPLVYIPSPEYYEEQKSTTQRTTRRPRRYSEAFLSDSPVDEDYDYDEKPVIKKRGIIMKPSVDEETDRKRALNREAAFRYREKKRAEQQGRKRDFAKLGERNRRLKTKERQLIVEIAKVRKRLVEMGVTLN